jgi:catechol 2,3-dioxygenase-like lactoylglutathione lyase family enzyme
MGANPNASGAQHGLALREITITVSDSARALAFYTDLLGFPLVNWGESPSDDGAMDHLLDVGNGHQIRLRSYATPPAPSPWLPDDLQVGYRHIGFQVQDADATTARLKAAGTPFTLDPLDAVGGVRIAFFKDPDGTLLEVVQGGLDYHRRGDAIAAQRPDQPQPHGPGELIFDHIAISVSELDQAVRFYTDRLGVGLLGQLFFQDARGFTITYLQAGRGVLELFSFGTPTTPRPTGAETALGINRMGFSVADPDAEAAQLTDPDGNVLEIRHAR